MKNVKLKSLTIAQQTYRRTRTMEKIILKGPQFFQFNHEYNRLNHTLFDYI